MKQLIPGLFFIGLISAVLYTGFVFSSPDKVENKHHCRWGLCPYEGVNVADRREAIIEYTGTEDTDAYYIDDLHFLNPNAEYDELDSLLFASGYHKK